MSKIQAWLQAARLRTLPLSVSGILAGTALAGIEGYTNTLVFILALMTTIGFQITSNFANDYGDGVKGTDNEDRIGPERALQSGALSRKELHSGILISIIIDLLLVALVLYTAFEQYPLYIAIFGFLGILCIWAAIKYTVGKDAYGYRGLGDLFVFLFFGILSVMGSMFLFTKYLTLYALLPASAIGLLSTAVLNLNNMRDISSDSRAGKNTLAVKLGPVMARRYHNLLVLGSLVLMIIFTLWKGTHNWHLIPLIAYVPLVLHLFKINRLKDPKRIDPELKIIALSTFLLSMLFYLAYNFL